MLKIRLEKWEKAVVMQVLEQSKDITEELSVKGFRQGDFSLETKCNVELDSFTVYVRGRNSLADFDIGYLSFDNNMERDEYYNNVVALFNAFNNRKKKDKNAPEPNTFIME